MDKLRPISPSWERGWPLTFDPFQIPDRFTEEPAMSARYRPSLLIVLVSFASNASAEDAAPMYFPQQAPAACACVEHSCKLVPEVKQLKKTVYEVQEVPF